VILALVSISVAKADSSLQIDATLLEWLLRAWKITEIGVKLISQRSGVVNVKAGKLLQSY